MNDKDNENVSPNGHRSDVRSRHKKAQISQTEAENIEWLHWATEEVRRRYLPVIQELIARRYGRGEG